MANENLLRDGLKTRLATITSLNAYDDWPDHFDPPGAIVLPIATEEELTFGSNASAALTQFDFEILVAVSYVNGLKHAQEQLGGFVSPHGSESIRAAIAGDRTLGGIAHSVAFLGWDRPDNEPFGDNKTLLGRRLTVRVWAS